MRDNSFDFIKIWVSDDCVLLSKSEGHSLIRLKKSLFSFELLAYVKLNGCAKYITRADSNLKIEA